MKRAAILLLFLAPTGVYAQASGQETLTTCAAKLKAASSLSCKMAVTFPDGKPEIWSLAFLKPNYYRIISPDQEFRSDGKLESSYIVSTKQYQYTDRQGAAITDAPFALELNSFFTGEPAGTTVTSTTATIDGKPVKEVQIQEPGLIGLTNLYFDSTTDLPIGYDEPVMRGQLLTVRYQELSLNSSLKPDSFAWSPPAGARPLLPTNLGSKLVQPGQPAPVEPASSVQGSSVDLAHEFSSHRATLLYFWPSAPPFPDESALRQLETELGPQRLQIIVVVGARVSAAATKTLGAMPFEVVLDADRKLTKAYGVESQAEFVIGPDGKVGANFSGYDADGIAKALRFRGFRI